MEAGLRWDGVLPPTLERPRHWGLLVLWPRGAECVRDWPNFWVRRAEGPIAPICLTPRHFVSHRSVGVRYASCVAAKALSAVILASALQPQQWL